LGPGSIDQQLDHSRGFRDAWLVYRTGPPANLLDLGSGGGVPGLVLFDEWHIPAVFVDSMQKRTAFLSEALAWNDAPDEGLVVTARAEELARDREFAGHFELVTARSFGRPAVTAECACRFLRVGGLLIVSEPPESTGEDRWPSTALAAMGLRPLDRFVGQYSYQVLECFTTPDEIYPRRNGQPGKRLAF
jgi:16S rRNA (guanine527-N7)-methyltransferase